MWKSQEGKHEETVRVVYTLINEALEDFPPDLVDTLFEKVKDVPSSQYNEMYLLFLKDFTMRAREVRLN